MRGVAWGIFIVVLSMVLLQPWIEMYNLVKDKIILDAAILSACRVATRHALEENYYGVEENFGDLSASVDEDDFKGHFARAFEKTLNITENTSTSGKMTFTPNEGHWHTITVIMDFDDYDEGDFQNRMVTNAYIYLETRYAFRTPMMRGMATALADVSELKFNMGVNRPYVIQIIN